jgi:hypothetical protein
MTCYDEDARVGLVAVLADLANPEHQRAIVALTEAYARDPMGN